MKKTNYEENVKKIIESIETYKEKVNYDAKDAEFIQLDIEKKQIEIDAQQAINDKLFEMAKLASDTDRSFADKMLEEEDKLRKLESEKEKLEKEKDTKEKVSKELISKKDNLKNYINGLEEEKKDVNKQIEEYTSKVSEKNNRIKALKNKENKTEEELEELNTLIFEREEIKSNRKDLMKKLAEINKGIKAFDDYEKNGYTKPEPTKPEPAKPEPAKPEPTKPEPAKPEPTKPEPAKPEPVKPEPAKPEPAKPEPTKPEPAKPEPAKPEPAKPEPEKLEPENKNEEIEKMVNLAREKLKELFEGKGIKDYENTDLYKELSSKIDVAEIACVRANDVIKSNANDDFKKAYTTMQEVNKDYLKLTPEEKVQSYLQERLDVCKGLEKNPEKIKNLNKVIGNIKALKMEDLLKEGQIAQYEEIIKKSKEEIEPKNNLPAKVEAKGIWGKFKNWNNSRKDYKKIKKEIRKTKTT